MENIRRAIIGMLLCLPLGCWAWAQQGSRRAPAPATDTDTVIAIGFEREHGEGYQAPNHKVVDDPAQAHGGRRCLFGEIAEPATYRMMAIPLRTATGQPIALELWARADNGSRLAIWVRQGSERRSGGAIDSVGPDWRRYSFQFSGVGDGEGQVEIVGPSSMGGSNPGKMWIDDVRLVAAPPPAGIRVRLQERTEDLPVLAVDSAGVPWGAWLRSVEGHDSIQVARLRPPAEGAPFCQRDRVWDVQTPADSALADPVLAVAGERAWLAFAGEVNRQWDLFLCLVGPEGPGKIQAITRDAHVDVKPALCAGADGRLWLAWESNRDGERAVYAAGVGADGRAGRPERLSAAGASAYNPSAAAVPGGVAVAYDSFRDSNSDIYLRALSAGQWAPERRLTDDARLERHPVLAARGSELWLAWQAQAFRAERYTMNGANAQAVRVARVDAEGLQAPREMAGRRFTQWVSRPGLAFDTDGRLWLSARRSLGQHDGWDTLLTCYSGAAWSPPVPLVAQQGRVRRTALAAAGRWQVAAEQVDDLPRAWPTGPNAVWHSNALYPCVDLSTAPAAAPLALEPWHAPPAPDFDLKTARAVRGEEQPRRGIEYGRRQLSLYWGDLHDHSNVSVCDRRTNPPPEDLFANLRDIARLDFAGLTDHDYNFDAYLWAWNGKYARLSHDPGRFVCLLAQEWTSDQIPNAEHPHDRGAPHRHGHRNFFFADPFFPRWHNSREGTTPRQVWDALNDADFVSIPHQLADTGNCPTDWAYTDEKRQPVAEIYQTRGSYEYLGAPLAPARAMKVKGHYLQDAWERGIIIGVVAAPDHGGGRGKAAVYAERLDRETILDAIRARHTYGTTGARIFLDVRVNGRLMGEVAHALAASQAVEVAVKVVGTADLDAVEVCRNNTFIHKAPVQGRAAEFVFRDTAPPAGRLWYYVRAIQKDSEMAWSSPVWLGRGTTD